MGRRLTAACVVQDGRLVSTLTEAEARTELAALGPIRGSRTRLAAALRRRVGTVPSILHMPEHLSDFMIYHQGNQNLLPTLLS